MTAKSKQTRERLRQRLGSLGAWSIELSMVPAQAARSAARRIEQLGYHSLWLGEGPASREALTNAGLMLAATERLVVATGIASIYARDATNMNAAALSLAEAYPDRFVLGIGASHRVNVESRGHGYGKPVATMRAYIDQLEAAGYEAAPPSNPPALVLAALRERMLTLAADCSTGAHTYFVPVEHTARARATLGPEPVLVVEQAVRIDADPDSARAAARAHMDWYLGQPNYVNNLRALGYGDADLGAGGSDRLADALVAWGEPAAVSARVSAQLAAGADHVVLQPLADSVEGGIDFLEQIAYSSKIL